MILKQAREDGIDLPFMGGDGWDSPKVVEIAGAEALKNTYITNHYSPEDEDAKTMISLQPSKRNTIKHRMPLPHLAMTLGTTY